MKKDEDNAKLQKALLAEVKKNEVYESMLALQKSKIDSLRSSKQVYKMMAE